MLWPEAVALARAVAVLDTDAELAHAAGLADIALESAVAAADALIEARVLAPGRPLRFAHPIIRHAVYADLPERRRALDHAHAAAILGARGQTDRAAVHLLPSDPAGDPGVVVRLREAAQRALGRGAPGVAVAMLRRALEEPPGEAERFATTFELGRAARLAGDPTAIQLLKGSLEHAPTPTPKRRPPASSPARLSPPGRLMRRCVCSSGLPAPSHRRQVRSAFSWRPSS